MISLRFKGVQFRCRVGMAVWVAAGMAGCIALGRWQWHRADEKRAWLDDYARHAQSPLQWRALQPPFDRLRYRPVVVDGRYDSAHSLLLENRFWNHRLGYHVVTPFVPDEGSETGSGGRAVLIDRGWIPRDRDRGRDMPPTLAPRADKQTVLGLVQIPPRPLTLGAVPPAAAGWPLRVASLDLPRLSARLKYPLYPFVLLLDPSARDGFTRDWQPPTTVSPQKHIAYAWQWFSFAAVLLILLICLHTRRIHRHD